MKKTMKKLLVLAWGLLAAGPVFPKVKLPSVLPLFWAMPLSLVMFASPKE